MICHDQVRLLYQERKDGSAMRIKVDIIHLISIFNILMKNHKDLSKDTEKHSIKFKIIHKKAHNA